ncbi:hypothetical protein L1049_020950 [Liquidambar formosana]|uniref:NAC domain-containing protein n=1 Tax=Liquidambar formosana TaxID=63359 RepID=A0AAP0S8L3_LIQFO
MAVITLKSLPLGYRFRPTDKELIDFYLRRKINGHEEDVRVIREIDICKREPWELPDLSALETNDKEWFFFCPRDHKYPTGLRLNRATDQGYWKATGKDREIKNRSSIIGMKKTLVFYRGRAPKGKRTNWVMHEYRTTLEELDGTHPGQGAFVLCRLFKKQDESIEGSPSDGGEPTVSSPTTPISPSECSQSEQAQVTPVSGQQAEMQPTNYESCQDEDFEKTTPDTLIPAECHSNSYNANYANDQGALVTAPEGDPQLEEYMDADFFCNPRLEPKDCKIFSPLHSQMRAELGSYMHHPVHNDFGDGHSGSQLQYGTNEQEENFISEFLNSIINNSDEDYCGDPACQKNLAVESETLEGVTPVSLNLVSIKDSGSCSESDQEVVQAQLNPELVTYDGWGQSLPWEPQARFDSLQMETTPGHYRTLIADNSNDEGRRTSSFIQIRSPGRNTLSAGISGDQFDNLSLKESSSHTNAVRSNDIIGRTGIRIRDRPPHNQPGTQNVITQGTALRRMRLQTKLEVGPFVSCKMREEEDEAKSTVTEEGEAAENHTTVDEPLKNFLPESDEEVTMNMKPKLRSRSNIPKGSEEKVPSMLLKAIQARHSVLSSVYMRRVVVIMVIILFIFFVGICICLKS